MILPGFGVTTINRRVRLRDPCFRFALKMKWLPIILLKESSNRPSVLTEMKKAEVVSHTQSDELHRTLRWAWTISRSLIYERIDPLFTFLWFTIVDYPIRLQAISCFRRALFSNVHFQIAGKQFFKYE